MNTNEQQSNSNPLRGNLLRLGERRVIAIYLRDGMTWVADFRNNRIEVCTMSTWLSVNQGGRVLRGMALDAITPLSVEVAVRIERQHQRMAPPSVNPEVARAFAALITGLRGTLKRIAALASNRPASTTAWKNPG